MKLALGTVQFGMDYGVANNGRVSCLEVDKILRVAHGFGIDTLDTAIAYGDSESVLGCCGMDSWKVITKLPPIPDHCRNIKQWVRAQLNASMQRLKVDKLYGLLLHKPSQLNEKNGSELYSELQLLKLDGLVDKVGISIYSHLELEAVFGCYKFEIVQAPLNIFDRRLIETGWDIRLKQAKVELHARSVFLQGLLLMPAQNRPKKFSYWSDVWDIWDSWLSSNNLTPLQACLRYLCSLESVDRIVIGVDSEVQLNQIVEAIDGCLFSLPVFNTLLDDRLINPSSWSSL